MSWKPVFVGNFRSGTTLLVNLLAYHPDLAPWFETKGLCEPLRWMRVLKTPGTMPFESTLARPHGGDGFSLEIVLQRLRIDARETADRIGGRLQTGKGSHERYTQGADLVGYDLAFAEAAQASWAEAIDRDGPSALAEATGALIRRLGVCHAETFQKPLWINKTPEMPRFGRELREALGPCRILLMVRDGREVVQSARALGWGEPKALADWWKGLILESRAASSDVPEDYLEVRYEDLLRDPQRTLDQILDFLGVGGSAASLIDRAQKAGLEIRPATSKGNAIDPEIEAALDHSLLESLGYG